MNRNKSLIFVALTAALSAFACSGPPVSSGNNNNGGGSGNATLSILLTAAPPTTAPPNANILSFSVTISSLSLSPASGSPVSIPMNAGSSAYAVDLTRLQSDSAFLGPQSASPLVTVPAGTYNSISLALSNPVVTYCTTSTTGQGCAANSVKTASVTTGVAAPVITFSPALVLTANQQTGIALNFNVANALTVNSSTQVVSNVNLGAANLFTVSTLPPSSSSLITGQLGFTEDLLGNVTAISGQSVTVQTATLGSITATANSTSSFAVDCANLFNRTQTFQSCVKVGDVASIDATLDANGTFTLLNYDPIDSATHDWIEGVLTAPPTVLTTAQFQIVANSFVVASSGSLISGNVSLAQPINVTVPVGTPFEVDNDGLTPLQSDTDVNNFSTGTMFPGQSLAIRASAFTSVNGTADLTASAVMLRFSRVTGIISVSSLPTSFSIQGLPPFFGLTTPLNVAISQGAAPDSISTNFEGTSPTNPSNFSSGSTVSMRAMYLNPNNPIEAFVAAKVRIP